MSQCPACASFNDDDLVFCGQCGYELAPARKRRLRRPRSLRPLGWLIVLQVLLFAGVIWIVMDSSGTDDETSAGGSDPAKGDSNRAMAVVPGKGDRSKVETDDARAEVIDESPEDEVLDVAEVTRRVERTLVVVELSNSEGRPLREIRGVLIHPTGAVLCRYAELLGAYEGACRLSQDGTKRVPVTGIIRQDAQADLALLRLDLAGKTVPALPLIDAPPGEVFESGAAVWVFSGHRPRSTTIDVLELETADGRFGSLLANGVVPESFLVVERSEAAVLGLCRPLVESRTLPPGRGRVSSEAYRVFVDPAGALISYLQSEAQLTLAANTQQFFEGSFADLVTRAKNAYRRKTWNEAITLFAQALERGTVERVEDAKLGEVERLLRESYLSEIARLRNANRFGEAGDLAGVALQIFTQDPVLWFELAGIRIEQGLLPEAIAALLETRELEDSPRVEPILEASYRRLAVALLDEGDDRRAELAYIEGIEQLPRSGVLRLELGSLYARWEAYEDAIRLLEEAKSLDVELRAQADILLDKIDDILAARDAVVIPIPAGSSSIRAKVRIDESIEETFMVDTGATYTSISEDLASRLGYSLAGTRTVRVKTAAGPLTVRVIELKSVTLGGYGVRNLEALVLPKRAGSAVNLLGLNFLNFFKFSVDSKRREFRLERQ